MELWTIWGAYEYSGGIHLDDRKLRSMYNWLFNSSYGTITTYERLSKKDQTVTLAVL